MLARFLLILVLLFPSTTCFAFDVTFHDKAVVDGATLTLGDLANFSEQTATTAALASRIIAQAPPPGKTTTLASQAIIKSLYPELHAVAEIRWQGAAQIKVTRNSIQITAAQIKEYITDYLKEHRAELPKAKIRFIPQELPMPFFLPVGTIQCEVTPSSPRIIGTTRFALIFKVDGQVRKNISVRGRLKIEAPVAVLTRSVKRDSVVNATDLAMKTMDISKINDPCLDKQTAIGQLTKRNLKAGTPLSMQHISIPPMIRKGELVQIVITHKGLNLTATGIARSDGKRRETIRVQNLSSKKTIYARVSAPGIVEVNL